MGKGKLDYFNLFQILVLQGLCINIIVKVFRGNMGTIIHLFVRSITYLLDISPSPRISPPTWKLVSDMSSFCNDKKKIVREVDHVHMNIRKQTIHSLSGRYFPRNCGSRLNASINIPTSWLRITYLEYRNIYI